MFRSLLRPSLSSWRRPTGVALLPLVVALQCNLQASVLNLVKVSQPAQLPLSWSSLLLWWALGLISYGWVGVGAWCWGRWHRRSGFRLPTGQHWLVFGLWALAFCLSAGLMRSALALWCLPEVITPTLARNFVVGQALVCFGLFWGCEWLGHHLEGRRQRLALKGKLLAHLAEEQSTWVRTDDRQRQQAAEWLHGRVQSLLWGAWAEWQQARRATPDQASLHLQALRTKLATVAHESQQPLLSPVMSGVLDQVPWRLAELAKGFQGQLEVALQVAPDWSGLKAQACDGEVLAAALLVAEESLLNACKHGQSTRAWLGWEPGPAGWVRLSILSDGPATPGPERGDAKGLGLGVMLPHLEGLGGRCSWQAGGGEPCGWVLSLPLVGASA